MANPYSTYYVNQAGSGLAGFDGIRYQKGHGFFGKVYGILQPVLKYLGKYALKTGYDIAYDALKNDNDGEVLIKRRKDGALNMGYEEDSNRKQKRSVKQRKSIKRPSTRKRKLKRIKLFEE